MNASFIGVLHLLLSFATMLYPFVFQKNWGDDFFVLYILIVYLLWTLHGGQCAVSFYSKQFINSAPPKKSIENDDILALFTDKRIPTFLMKVSAALLFVGIYIVFMRNNIPIPILVLMIIYYYASYFRNNTLNLGFAFIFFSLIMFFLFKIIKKYT